MTNSSQGSTVFIVTEAGYVDAVTIYWGQRFGIGRYSFIPRRGATRTW